MPKAAPRVTPRERLLVSLDEAIRKVGAQAVLISDLVATRVGINSTDLECLDLLQLDGPSTAGQMSARSGLTTGATTAMIDRLEKAGYVRRRRDASDRRLVMVEVLDHCGSHITPLYQPIQKDLEKLHARYSNRELEIVVRYLSEATEAGARFVTWLQAQPSQSKHHARLSHVRRGPLGKGTKRRVQEQTTRSARRKNRAPQESTS
jgi:DNA-binding MarR family transcriptional regulator